MNNGLMTASVRFDVCLYSTINLVVLNFYIFIGIKATKSKPSCTWYVSNFRVFSMKIIVAKMYIFVVRIQNYKSSFR